MRYGRSNKYGKAAIQAVEEILNNPNVSPIHAWEKATLEIFGHSPSQKKGCPKGAFLGLCEEGLVKGIAKGKYSNSIKNKDYAIRIIEYLKHHSEHEFDRNKAWKYATRNNNITCNNQLDVVLALKNEGLLIGFANK